MWTCARDVHCSSGAPQLYQGRAWIYWTGMEPELCLDQLPEGKMLNNIRIKRFYFKTFRAQSYFYAVLLTLLRLCMMSFFYPLKGSAVMSVVLFYFLTNFPTQDVQLCAICSSALINIWHPGKQSPRWALNTRITSDTAADAQTGIWLNELCIKTNSGSSSFCSRGAWSGWVFCRAIIHAFAGRRGLVSIN